MCKSHAYTSGLGEEEPDNQGVGEATDGKYDIVPPVDQVENLGADLSDHEVYCGAETEDKRQRM